jgi:ligand-binding sensor protein
MSSWKQSGGINFYDRGGKINADTIAVNRLILKEPYVGTFDICGQLHVSGNVQIDNSLTVENNLTTHNLIVNNFRR